MFIDLSINLQTRKITKSSFLFDKLSQNAVALDVKLKDVVSKLEMLGAFERHQIKTMKMSAKLEGQS